jgi:hypothetical protein
MFASGISAAGRLAEIDHEPSARQRGVTVRTGGKFNDIRAQLQTKFSLLSGNFQ